MTAPAGEPMVHADQAASHGSFNLRTRSSSSSFKYIVGIFSDKYILANMATNRVNVLASYINSDLQIPRENGLDYVGFSSAYRDGLLADNTRSSRGETGLEITYADRLLGPVLVQPDLQVIFHPQGDQRRPTAKVATVRFTVEF